MINYIDRMADSLVDVLKYSDSNVAWPESEDVKPDPEIKAEWFYPALQSSDCSEITAILLYTQQSGLYDEEIGDLVLGIALVEMKHFANIRDTVIGLGGTIPQPFNDSQLKLGKDVGEALSINIQSEYDTIMYYESVKAKITSQSETGVQLRAMLDKLIADETLHLKLFMQALHKRNLSHLISNISDKLYETFPMLKKI